MAKKKENETKKEVTKKEVKSTIKATSNKVKDSKKSSTVKTKKVADKKRTTKKASKKTSEKKATTSKKEPKAKAVKESNLKKVSTKTVNKKSNVKSTAKKEVKKNTTKSNSSKPKTKAKAMLAEYYDLPYGYNETTVKILAQTPTTLFVYWDISEDDRNNLISKFGENFFYETRPILIVHNITKNYSFEIEINDFANSWYIRCQEPNCDYTIELGRKAIQRPDEYIYIDSSNDIVSPNDHILFEKSDLGHVRFRNIKTGTISVKDYGSLRFINNIDKLYGNIYDVYSALYKNDLNELTNPTSGEFIMR